MLCPTAVYETVKFARALEALATDEQKSAWLPDLVRGERRAVAVLHDPADAADVEPRLRAERVSRRLAARRHPRLRPARRETTPCCW